LVIPSILLSQALASISAALFHHKYHNIDLHPKEDDIKITIFIIIVGMLAIFLGILISLQLPELFLKVYIGILVVAIGTILLRIKEFRFSIRRLSIIGIISVFNKTLTGAGFGSVFCSGQIISGKKTRSSIGTTTIMGAPICLFGFFGYFIVNGAFEPTLLILLIAGALFATPFGPKKTARLKEESARRFIGVFMVFLGIITLINIFF